MKKVAIMQPYFLPYIGYWQLLSSVDEFVVYDNIEYTKKGWFNRNRILVNGSDYLFTIPIKKDSDYLDVSHRQLSVDSKKEIDRLLRIININYKKAPYFNDVYTIIEKCFTCNSTNLFDYIYNSIKLVATYLDITTPIIKSSSISFDQNLKAEKKVLAICNEQHAEVYVNAIGGKELYNPKEFAENNMQLRFIQTLPIEYKQFLNEFVPNLSIIDVLMFNSKDQIKQYLSPYYRLIE